jgi:hypothetical protein
MPGYALNNTNTKRNKNERKGKTQNEIMLSALLDFRSKRYTGVGWIQSARYAATEAN